MPDAGAAMRLIRARIPELGPATLVLVESALNGDVVPATALEDVLTLLEALEARMDALMEDRWEPLTPDEDEDAGLSPNGRPRPS